MYWKMLVLISIMIISLLYDGIDGEYTCNIDDLIGLTNVTSVRTPLPTSTYPEECSRSLAYPDCKRSPCQNLVQCRCTNTTTGKSPPGVNCWKPGRQLTTHDGKCRSDIPIYTAVSIFNDAGHSLVGACGVFMGCKTETLLTLLDQACFKDLGNRDIPSTSFNYKTLYTIEVMDILKTPVGAQADCVELPSSLNNCSLNLGICKP